VEKQIETDRAMKTGKGTVPIAVHYRGGDFDAKKALNIGFVNPKKLLITLL